MISKHVSDKEGVYSATALRRGLDNTPNEEQLKCMREIAEKLFEPLREWVGGPIKINSFFRGEPVNTAIGGSKRSQHMKGQAMDLDDTFGYKTNSEMYHYIKDNLEFDQLILEFYRDNEPTSGWIHCSYSTDHNRHQSLRAQRIDGKVTYTPWLES